MGTDWIPAFQQDMERLHAQLLILQTFQQTEDRPREDLSLRRSIEEIGILLTWARALTSDEAVWRLVNIPRLCHQILSWLTIIMSNFKSMDNRTSDDSPLSAAIDMIVLSGARAISVINRLARGHEQPSPMWPFYTIAPDVLLEVLRLSLYPRYVAVWHVSSMPQEARLTYHPHHTQRLLCFLIEGFNASFWWDEVRLAATSTSEGLIIALTAPTLCLTPALWQRQLASLRSAAHDATLEVWLEMGGTLDPLTWDEGQGQGVLVRMPWAKP